VPVTISADGRSLDADQQHLVEQLDLVLAALSSDDASTVARRGLYVHGAVGRGKTWLCDAFFAAAPTAAKRRVHLHDLLHDLHRAIWQARSERAIPAAEGDDSVAVDASSLAGNLGAAAAQDVTELAIGALLGDVELLYIDEVYCHDSANAVLLCRVLQSVFERGILVLATSNVAPDELLPNPEFHSLIEPAVALIEAHLDVVRLGGTIDYRRLKTPGRAAPEAGFAHGFWVSPAELETLSPAGLTRPTTAEHGTLSTNGRTFAMRRAGDGAVWFHFDDLCEGYTSVADYLVWAGEFHTWVIEGLPPLHTASPQARQRFAHIVDVLVDRDVTLHVVSESDRDEVFRAAEPRDAARLQSRLALLRTAS
jgi:cell division protein ZapE